MWLWQQIPHYDSHLSINVKTTLFFINFNHSNPRELASLLNVCTLGSNSKSHKRVGKLQYFDKTVVILCHLKWKVTKHTVTIYRIRFNDEIRGKITCIEKTVNWETPLQVFIYMQFINRSTNFGWLHYYTVLHVYICIQWHLFSQYVQIVTEIDWMKSVQVYYTSANNVV